ncbi:uncharacterized mitochondrial protein AtMg00820-like [Cicer arietinum]|uniref:uncharacterized mitochondrial protein AtMg00820-like n=1 Tax=Cicer arietinum TaxID=3827 RepID=UPI003CC5E958
MEEINAIERNQTWYLTDLPPKQMQIGVKWVYKLKLNPYGIISKYKARLVCKGFLQRASIDYSKVFALVAIIETIRLVIALVYARGWLMCQLDVKSAFLNGWLEE